MTPPPIQSEVPHGDVAAHSSSRAAQRRPRQTRKDRSGMIQILQILALLVRDYLVIGLPFAAWMAYGFWRCGYDDADLHRLAEKSFDGPMDAGDRFAADLVGSRIGALVAVTVFWPAIARDLVAGSRRS